MSNTRNIEGYLDRADRQFGKMMAVIEDQRWSIGDIVAKDDEEFADRVRGYCDRVEEILMDLEELNIEKLKGE
jgi:hypothetical protein